MSESNLPRQSHHRAALAKFWLAAAFLVAVGIGLAWLGAGAMRSNTVQVETLEPGSGELIKPVDGVFVEYEGRLSDGTVFDSSASHGGPQPMIAGQVIPGFAEALGQMREGGRYKVAIPARLAYGATPPPGSPIPPNSDLEFDVHIVDVVPDAALMAAQQQQQMQELPQAQTPPQPQPEQPQRP